MNEKPRINSYAVTKWETRCDHCGGEIDSGLNSREEAERQIKRLTAGGLRAFLCWTCEKKAKEAA